MCRVVECKKAEIRSNLGNKLAEISYKEGGDPVGVVLRKMNPKDKSSGYYTSLRGFNPKDGNLGNCPDLEEVASFYGGGGHPLAAGCTLTRFPSLINNK